MTALKVFVVSFGLFTLAFAQGLTGSILGSPHLPCEGALLVYCWTSDVLGGFLAWTLWVGGFSVAIGWAIVVLPRSYREA